MKKERVAKVCKVCRKYLIHEQKSVFEGMITQAKLQQLRTELERYIVPLEDSIQIYKIESIKYASKEKIGIFQNQSNIL